MGPPLFVSREARRREDGSRTRRGRRSRRPLRVVKPCCYARSGSLGQPARRPDLQRHSAKSMQPSPIRWEWNDLKAIINFRKHKVSFELAAAALDDPNQLSQMDTDAYEHRFKTLAMIEGVVFLVVHTEPELEEFSGSLVGRIISARKATPAERRAYSNG